MLPPFHFHCPIYRHGATNPSSYAEVLQQQGQRILKLDQDQCLLHHEIQSVIENFKSNHSL